MAGALCLYPPVQEVDGSVGLAVNLFAGDLVAQPSAYRLRQLDRWVAVGSERRSATIVSEVPALRSIDAVCQEHFWILDDHLAVRCLRQIQPLAMGGLRLAPDRSTWAVSRTVLPVSRCSSSSCTSFYDASFCARPWMKRTSNVLGNETSPQYHLGSRESESDRVCDSSRHLYRLHLRLK